MTPITPADPEAMGKLWAEVGIEPHRAIDWCVHLDPGSAGRVLRSFHAERFLQRHPADGRLH